MKNDIFSQLDAELAHAGEKTQLSPPMLLLEQCRITPEKALRPMEFLFRLFGKPCFPRGELVAITGKAKSGKTFVTSMLMAKGLTPKSLTPKGLTPKSLTPAPSPREGPTPYPSPREGSLVTFADAVPSLQRYGDDPLRVLWYDTEQSDESTQDILKNRIIPMMSSATSLSTPLSPWRGAGGEAFNVRAVEWKLRRELLREAITQCKPDLVIVDSIRDLVNDINDGVLAQEVMEELLHLATQENCCIVCVLHQNKSGEDRNLRGWIGTELMNKAFEVYACEKLMPQRIFKLEQTLTRKYDIEQTLYFEVGDDGLPKEASPSPIPEGGEKRREGGLPQLNAEYIVHDDSIEQGWQIDVMRLFLDAMRGREEIGGGELRTEVCRLGNITQYTFYNKLLQRAIDEKVIVKTERDRRVFYQPAPF
ncbi:MAG: hypothetical protein IJ841_11500 [Prevotella sp.]|nr:hypothetical protein [Prevotella sp.]